MSLVYGAVCTGVRAVSRLALDLEIEGAERVPATGPCVLVLNHLSILDPILVQAHCPRVVHSMTKSTQFSTPLMRWLLPRVHAFPTRRYRVDPQAVRVALRRLEAGEVVGIYPEGERSWDGRLQPLRRGAVRLILKAGAPVVPVGITGTFALWPRWSRKIRRAPVRIHFGEALDFGRHDDRRAREALLPDAMRTIETELRRLTGREVAGLAGQDR